MPRCVYRPWLSNPRRRLFVDAEQQDRIRRSPEGRRAWSSEKRGKGVSREERKGVSGRRGRGGGSGRRGKGAYWRDLQSFSSYAASVLSRAQSVRVTAALWRALLRTECILRVDLLCKFSMQFNDNTLSVFIEDQYNVLCRTRFEAGTLHGITPTPSAVRVPFK